MFSNEARSSFELQLVASRDEVSNVVLSGTTPQRLAIFSDSKPKENDHSIEDVTAGLVISVGEQYEDWQVKLEYIYRYRFDLNGQYYSGLTSYLFETEIQRDSLMLHIGREFHYNERYKVIILLGIGVTKFNTETRDWRDWSLTEDSHSDFSWQSSVSIQSEISERWEFSLGYQYGELGKMYAKVDYDNSKQLTGNYKTNGLFGKLIYNF